jgi:ATP-binding cassette, subfamily B, bacterial MsbA
LIGLMFWLNWQLSLFTLIVGPMIALLVRYISLRFRRISTRIQDSIGAVTHAAEEAIQNQRTVKVYGGQEFERAGFGRANELNRYLMLKLTATQASSSAVIQFIGAGAVAGVVYFATLPHMLEQITPGTFVTYMGAMLALLGPLKNLSTVNEKLQRGIAAATDLFRLMEEKPEPEGGTRRVQRARGDIECRQVSFRYRDDGDAVLQDISLRVQPGQTVAFVGRSGSGKSTLLGLLPRFYDPSQGAILLDGHDLRDYRLADLRRQIAFVDQQVRLFNATVAENIAYGFEQPPPREAIVQAARDAYAWEFIEHLPQELDTSVGQNGVMLSGGQRQRLAIARALLKDAPILILDEATSALDTESERYIQRALERLVSGRTTLVIAHRLSTIQNADVIVVMHEGRIVETGTHTELLGRQGHYAALHRMQFEE